MDWINFGLGCCTALGFTLALYQFFLGKRRTRIEREKMISIEERFEHTKYSIAIVHDIVNLAVQKAKEKEAGDIVDLLRVARGSLEVAIRELEAERLKLKTWQFGEIFKSVTPDQAAIALRQLSEYKIQEKTGPNE